MTRPSRRLSSAGAYPGRIVTVGPAGAGSELPNVIVFVDLPAGEPSAPTHATIRQTNEVFVPRVAAVTRGSTVDFANDDAIFHNVFSLSRAATFDLGRYPRGESKSRRFDRPGVVKVFCHLHSHMTALVRVFDHPYSRCALTPTAGSCSPTCRRDATAWWRGTSASEKSGTRPS